MIPQDGRYHISSPSVRTSFSKSPGFWRYQLRIRQADLQVTEYISSGATSSGLPLPIPSIRDDCFTPPQ
ncbi:MAG: hypothetical protein ACLU1V_14490 [Bacteroides fragilis]